MSETLCVVEIPMGSRNRYEWSDEHGRFLLDRFLSSSVVFPTDYGYVPGTDGGDGDPLDVLSPSRSRRSRAAAFWHVRSRSSGCSTTARVSRRSSAFRMRIPTGSTSRISTTSRTSCARRSRTSSWPTRVAKAMKWVRTAGRGASPLSRSSTRRASAPRVESPDRSCKRVRSVSSAALASHAAPPAGRRAVFPVLAAPSAFRRRGWHRRGRRVAGSSRRGC